MNWTPLIFNQRTRRSKPSTPPPPPSSSHISSHSSSVAGLRILLTHNNYNNHHPKIYLVSALLNPRKPRDAAFSYCSLRSCSLCNKPLTIDKEVYMYRGNRGFCSVECRSRQICSDERKEAEISTTGRLGSSRRRRDGGRRRESSALSEECRRGDKTFSWGPRRPPIFTIS